MSRYYNMAGEPIDRDEALRLFNSDHARRVGWDRRGDITVSTVLLVLDHRWDDGPPMIFETMIFGGDHDK